MKQLKLTIFSLSVTLKWETSKCSSHICLGWLYCALCINLAGFFSALLRGVNTLGHARIMSKSWVMRFVTSVG